MPWTKDCCPYYITLVECVQIGTTFLFYDAFAMGASTARIIFSMKIPYPDVGSLMRTCVTAPMSLPSCTKGLSLTSVVK